MLYLYLQISEKLCFMAEEKKLTRSDDRKIAGVCSGIAEYFGWDATLVRIVYAVLSVFSAGFPGLILYLILWLVIPQKQTK